MAILMAGMALAACSQAPTGETADATASPVAETPVPTPAGTGTAPAPERSLAAATPNPPPAASSPPGKLPPADAPDRYVGRWAATEAMCEAGAWRFQRQRLATAGEVSCGFDQVSEAPGGYDIAATCHAEGQTTKDTIRLRFAESAQAMLVRSKMWDVGLIYCGPPE
jgi:hypothetical protein